MEELQQKLIDTQAQVDNLLAWKNSLESSHSVPRNVEGVLRERIKQPLFKSFTIAFAAINSLVSEDLTVSFPGALTGDCVALGIPTGATNSNNVFMAWVSSDGVVKVRHNNVGSSACTSFTVVFKIAVIRQ